MQKTKNEKNYTNLAIEQKENSEIEIKAEISENIVSKYREQIIKNQALLAITDIYPNIILDNNLNVIGRPDVLITKLAPKNPVGFTIKTAIMPEIKLPDYKKIAGIAILDKTETIVSEKEVDDIIEQIKKGIAENKSKENNSKEKNAKKREKRRFEIIEKVIEDTKIDIPKIFVESELDKMLAQFKDDIARMNVQFDKYLEKIKKTENISVPKENIKHEVNHILEHYKDAKPENVRVYVETVLTNEKVFQLLENQK